MALWTNRLICALAAITLLGCAAPRAPAVQESTAAPIGPPKRVTAAIVGAPKMLNSTFGGAQAKVPGLPEVASLLNAPLSAEDSEGVRRPQVAEAVPSVENGLWKIFPDGRMETTWRVRPGVLWHDGTPFNSQDLVFTARVLSDPEMPLRPSETWNLVERIDAPDPRTVTVFWKRPYIDADSQFEEPLPRHLLEKAYAENPAAFLNEPYWAESFVGTGPFRVKEFVLDSHLMIQANDQYVLGRPKLDTIEIRFIPDANTLAANFLAGQLDVTLGDALSPNQAIQIRDRWPDGRMGVLPIDNYMAIYPQFTDPRPPVAGDARFRRALTHALDRQEITDTLNYGLAPVAHSVFPTHVPEFRRIESKLVKYDYDPRKAAQIIEGLGYARAVDDFYRDGSGQKLLIELRVLGNLEKNVQTSGPVADYWQRAGVAVETVIIPPQRARDREYRSTRPAYELLRHTGGMGEIKAFVSSSTPSPETRWVGTNQIRLANPQYDAMVDRLFSTIPANERIAVLGDILHFMTDQVITFTIYHDVLADLVANRLTNFANGRVTYNAHEWDVTS